MKKIMIICVIMFGTTVMAKQSVKADFMKRLQAKARKIKTQSRSMHMEAIVTTNTPGGKVKIRENIFRKGKKIRMETTFIRGGRSKDMPAMFANMKTVTITTPRGTWMISPMGTHKINNKHDLPPGVDATNWITRITGHIGKVNKVAGGFLIELKNTGKWSEALFSNDLNVLQMTGRNKNNMELKILFKDYSNAGGLQVPRQIISFMGKKPIFEMKINRIRLNPDLRPALFDPAKVKVKPISIPQNR